MYGEPRVTRDVEIVIGLPARLVKPFAAASPLDRLGPSLNPPG